MKNVLFLLHLFYVKLLHVIGSSVDGNSYILLVKLKFLPRMNYLIIIWLLNVRFNLVGIGE